MPQRSVIVEDSPTSRLRQAPVVLNTWPSVTSPTGTEIGPPVSLHGRAADQAVGGLQGDGADHVVADVLGDLEVRCSSSRPEARRRR
jgi:hypothetical protein